LLMMLHPTQELEPPANPARFNLPSGIFLSDWSKLSGRNFLMPLYCPSLL
jgi:hypothetical protein